jgi:hypothetical protein
MFAESEMLLPLLRLPDLDSAVAPTGGYAVTVRRPCDGKDVIGVALVGKRCQHKISAL